VPYLKFSRDKRGYEHFSIIEPGTVPRGRPARPRLLFWFRTPPQVKVGRLPFTDDVRRAIEAQNPGLRFDWPRLLATPIPPPDAEHWRERRRIEKAARQAARDAEGSGAPEEVVEMQVAEIQNDAARDVHEIQETISGHSAVGEPDDAHEVEDGEGVEEGQAESAVQASDSAGPVTPAPAAAAGERAGGGRRRRRRGRRRPRPAGETAVDEAPPTVPVPPTEEV